MQRFVDTKGIVITSFFVAAVFMTIGCNQREGVREAIVSGTVSYQGKPIDNGEIRFVPIKGTQGPASLAYIKQGNYKVVARGGVPLGTHRVEIFSYTPDPNAKPYTEEEADGEFGIKAGDIPKKQMIPEKYNVSSTLEVTIDSDSGSVNHDFNLE